jgi:hypothetical protein
MDYTLQLATRLFCNQDHHCVETQNFANWVCHNWEPRKLLGTKPREGTRSPLIGSCWSKKTWEPIPVARACWGILLLQGHSRLLTIYHTVYPMVLKAYADFFHRSDIRTDHNNVQTVVPYHNNMFTGGFYGTTSTQKNVNASTVETKSQQPSLRSHHNQLLVLVA